MKEHRATEDMKVYKLLLVEHGRFGKIKFISPQFGFHYKPGKIYHTELGVKQTNYSLIINEGLHCFQGMASAGMYVDNPVGTAIIVTAIIPEGARYYVNEDGEIVTDKLMIVL